MNAATGDEEAELWRKLQCHGSEVARRKLFACHADFATHLARRHFRDRSRGDLDFGDLQQLAFTGLLEAIDRFDPARGAPFRAYAGRRVSGSIVDGIGRMTEVRDQLSSRARAQRDRMRSLSTKTAETLSSSEALAELAEIAMGLAIGFMLEGTGRYVAADDETAARLPTAYESLAWRDLIRQLEAELTALPEKEQAVLRHHYLSGVGFDELAKLFAVSRGRISQIHSAALSRLRKRLAQRGHFSVGG